MSSFTIVGYEPHTPECTNSLAFFPVQNSILWLIMLFVSCAVMMYIKAVLFLPVQVDQNRLILSKAKRVL